MPAACWVGRVVASRVLSAVGALLQSARTAEEEAVFLPESAVIFHLAGPPSRRHRVFWSRAGEEVVRGSADSHITGCGRQLAVAD